MPPKPGDRITNVDGSIQGVVTAISPSGVTTIRRDDGSTVTITAESMGAFVVVGAEPAPGAPTTPQAPGQQVTLPGARNIEAEIDNLVGDRSAPLSGEDRVIRALREMESAGFLDIEGLQSAQASVRQIFLGNTRDDDLAERLLSGDFIPNLLHSINVTRITRELDEVTQRFDQDWKAVLIAPVEALMNDERIDIRTREQLRLLRVEYDNIQIRAGQEFLTTYSEIRDNIDALRRYGLQGDENILTPIEYLAPARYIRDHRGDFTVQALSDLPQFAPNIQRDLNAGHDEALLTAIGMRRSELDARKAIDTTLKEFIETLDQKAKDSDFSMEHRNAFSAASQALSRRAEELARGFREVRLLNPFANVIDFLNQAGAASDIGVALAGTPFSAAVVTGDVIATLGGIEKIETPEGQRRRLATEAETQKRELAVGAEVEKQRLIGETGKPLTQAIMNEVSLLEQRIASGQFSSEETQMAQRRVNILRATMPGLAQTFGNQALQGDITTPQEFIRQAVPRPHNFMRPINVGEFEPGGAPRVQLGSRDIFTDESLEMRARPEFEEAFAGVLANTVSGGETLIGQELSDRAASLLPLLRTQATAAGLRPDAISQDPFMAFQQVVQARSRSDPEALTTVVQALSLDEKTRSVQQQRARKVQGAVL